MRQMKIGDYFKIKGMLDTTSKDLVRDFASEVLDELYNPKYVTDEERVTGVLEAIEFVSKIKLDK